jgi:hypothetical protein
LAEDYNVIPHPLLGVDEVSGLEEALTPYEQLP